EPPATRRLSGHRDLCRAAGPGEHFPFRAVSMGCRRLGHGGAGFPAHPDHPDGTVYRLVPWTISPGRADAVTALRRRRHHRGHLPPRYRAVLVLLCSTVQLLRRPAVAQHADHPGLACRYLPLWSVATRNDFSRSAASDQDRKSVV